MRLPRDLSANQLIKALRVVGYSIDHQRGSHIRIVTQFNGQHHETVPNQGGHLGAHSSEHRQTSQCQCGRSVIATGFVVRFKTMTGPPAGIRESNDPGRKAEADVLLQPAAHPLPSVASVPARCHRTLRLPSSSSSFSASLTALASGFAEVVIGLRGGLSCISSTA
jgi:predicted RNA binding protein YcfA (HicA-like mRNA interferase family)